MRRCEELGELLSAYCDGECTPEESDRVAEHLRVCEECCRLLWSYQEIQESFASREAPVNSEGEWGRIWAEIAPEVEHALHACELRSAARLAPPAPARLRRSAIARLFWPPVDHWARRLIPVAASLLAGLSLFTLSTGPVGNGQADAIEYVVGGPLPPAAKLMYAKNVSCEDAVIGMVIFGGGGKPR